MLFPNIKDEVGGEKMRIAIDRQKIAAFCCQQHIIKLSFFGSILRDDFDSDSDVDVLVEFDPEHIPTLLDLVKMEEQLSQLLGQKADLRTAEDLSRYFRDQVLASAEVQYVQE